MASSLKSAYSPARGEPAPSVQVTPPNQRSRLVKHFWMPWKAMISRSSWWAPMPRWVTRRKASSAAVPSGTKTEASGLVNFMDVLLAISGRLAAATACPTRRLFSSRRWMRTRAAVSGNSAARTSLALSTMIFAAGAGQDPAEDEQMAEAVEDLVPGDGEAEIDADRFEDPGRLDVAAGRRAPGPP